MVITVTIRSNTLQVKTEKRKNCAKTTEKATSSRASKNPTTKTRAAKRKNSTMRNTTKANRAHLTANPEASARKNRLPSKALTKTANSKRNRAKRKAIMMPNTWWITTAATAASTVIRNTAEVVQFTVLTMVLMNSRFWDTKRARSLSSTILAMYPSFRINDDRLIS